MTQTSATQSTPRARAATLALVAIIGLVAVLGVATVVRDSDDAAPTAAARVDPTERVESLAVRFATDWMAADWTAMTAYADDTVIALARESHVDELTVELVQPVTSSGVELLVVDPDSGPAKLFALLIDGNDLESMIDSLVPAGDAG